MSLPKISSRRFVDADVVAQRLGHLVDPVQPFQQRHGQDALGRLAPLALQLAPHQQVELLVGAAQFDVGLHGDGIVPLDQRIEELVDGDRLLAGKALVKVVPLQHAGHGALGGQGDHAAGTQLVQPGGVEDDLGLFRIEDLEDLFLVGLGIAEHVLAGQHLAGLGLAARIADHAGEVADQKVDLVPQLLELAQFLDQNRVPQVQVRGGGVETGLDRERNAAFQRLLQLLFQFLLDQDLDGTALDDGHLFGYGHNKKLLRAINNLWQYARC